MEAEHTIRTYLNLWDGNDLAFGRLLFLKTGERSPNAWRCAWQNFQTNHPNEVPEIENNDPNDLIPYEWDGKWEDLARRLRKQNDDITMRGWRHRIANARSEGRLKRSEKTGFTTEQYVGDGASDEELWDAVAGASTEAIQAHQDARWSEIRFHDEGYIGIAFAADQHIGSGFCDHERLSEDANLIADTPNLYVIHGGDFIDNFLGVDKPRPTTRQITSPSQQWRLCRHYLSIFNDKVVAVVAGNHDLWTDSLTDYDPLRDLVHDIGAIYHKSELNMRVLVGNQPYHISVRHKRRGNSSLHPARVVKKMWEDGEADFDIGVVCHNHTPTIEPFTRHGVERWAIRPGSYKVIDGFADSIGFPRDKPTCPVAILSPHEREIHVFSDLRLGIRTLLALNGGNDE